MAWSASGLYANTLATESLTGIAAATFGWNSATNKLFLTNNSDTPVYSQALGSAIYAVTNEVSGTGWAAGGVAMSALAAGATSMAPAFTVTGTTVVNWTGSVNVSVASTTLASPGAYGGYFYSTTAAAQYKYIGIYFGGTGYITTAGTFAITWSGGVICAITVATTS